MFDSRSFHIQYTLYSIPTVPGTRQLTHYKVMFLINKDFIKKTVL